MKDPIPSAADLLAAIVHDVKNPLVAVLANGDYLTRAPELSADTREVLAEVVEGARAVERILGDLGTLARALGGQLIPRLEDVDVAALAREAVTAAQPLATRLGVALTVEPDAGEEARVDAALLRQLLRVLVAAALRRAPQGSRVTVSTRVGPERASLRVLDEGPALDEARLAQLAAGINLLLVRGICEAHAGTLRVEIPASGGLLVSVDLPRAA